jgi:hypothetical protein
MSVKAGGYPDMTRRKNDSLPVAAPNELHQWLTSAPRHKLVKTREDVEQRTDDASEVDQLAADSELAAHEPVLPKDFDVNLAEELAPPAERRCQSSAGTEQTRPSAVRRRRSRREIGPYESSAALTKAR